MRTAPAAGVGWASDFKVEGYAALGSEEDSAITFVGSAERVAEETFAKGGM